MCQPMTIQSLCATFLTVFEDKVHEEHMNRAPDVPFFGGYLHATAVDQNDKVTDREKQNMVRRRKSNVLRQLRRKLPCLTAYQRHAGPEAASHKRAFAGLAWPIPMGPRRWRLGLRGFAWTRSSILKPALLRCVPIKTSHLFQIWHLGT